MADLVVGMAKSVVDGALTKAQAAIQEEAKLRQSAQRNLVFITSEFQMMQSFLKVADGERLIKNVVVMTLVRQIRDLAYDVEDCIEFVVHLDKRNRWWLRLLQSGHWLVPSCLPPLALDEAVAELERLKARVEDMSSRNARYSLINGSSSGSGSSKPAEPAPEDQPADATVSAGATAFDRLVIAMGTKKGNLTTHLVSRSESGCGDLRVIAVWGSGGGDLGMTSVVWNAYVDAETVESFPCRAWIKLRQPFNPHEFARSLAAQFFSNKCKELGGIIALDVLKKMEAKQGELHAELAQYLNNERFLVVLEELTSMEEWIAISSFFPKKAGENGSCIVVSTLNFEVASLSVGDPYRVLHLNQLSAHHSVYAFYKIMENQRGGDKGKKTAVPAPSGCSKKEEAAEWMKDHPLVGRESETKELGLRAVTAAKSYQVMSVWGIAGVGKSTLIKHMFCDKIVNSKLFKKYAWVDLSHPFNIWDFSRSLLLSFDSEDLQTKATADHGTMASRNPILECREMLQNKSQRCLIVIDGIQFKTEWDLIQAELVSASNPKNLIIVIASEEEIATHCCGLKGPYTYNVKGLGPEAAFCLFDKVSKKMKMISGIQQQVYSRDDDDDDVLKNLVLKSGGLPKVIVEIASLMNRMEVGWKDRARYINNKFIQELKNHGEFGGLKGLFCWMQLYFRNCPDSLKPCILYLSIFSPDLLIRRRRLVRRWIAEGYTRDSHEESAEEEGEKQFLDLLSLSIIQQASTVGLDSTRTRFVSCQVNGFFREYIVSQRMEENLVFELDGTCAVTTQRTGRHLFISKDWDRDRIVFKNIDFSRLRSLTVSGKWESFFISESMKLLRVLDLEDASGVKYSDLENIVKWSPRIKFLSLRGCTKIRNLPSSIGDLRQLQTLDVRHTSIKTLPANLAKLQNLQYLRAGNTSPAGHGQSTRHLPFSRLSGYCRDRHLAGVEVPTGIRKLTALHTLGVVNVSASGSKSILGDLKNITQLHKLGVSGINKNNSQKFFSAISILVHLESLSVLLDEDSEGCLDNISLPLESLRSLKLHGVGDKLPEWSKQLTMLTKIDLKMSTLMKQPQETGTAGNASSQGKKGVMMFLGMLPELCILRICVQQFQDGELIVEVVKNAIEDKSFEKVKILEIACGSSAKVTFGRKTMKKLEQLKVDCSIGSNSNYEFAGLGHLPELKEVWLKGSHDDDKLKKDLQSQLDIHEKTPVLKLE